MAAEPDLRGYSAAPPAIVRRATVIDNGHSAPLSVIEASGADRGDVGDKVDFAAGTGIGIGGGSPTTPPIGSPKARLKPKGLMNAQIYAQTKVSNPGSRRTIMMVSSKAAQAART